MRFSKLTAIVLLSLLGLGLIAVYLILDPSANLFPRCVFRSLTGYICPGCGSQRALHALLNFELVKAFNYNPLLVVSIPYILYGLRLEFLKNHNKIQSWIRTNLYGLWAVILWSILIILYWIWRNTSFYPFIV